jgi:Fe2+ transport system protein FeoA
MNCTLCGFEFDAKNAQSACQGCFLKNGCGLIRCPNCFFEMVRTQELEKWQKEKAPLGKLSIFPLTKLAVSQNAEISHVLLKDRTKLQKLIAMGALPKTKITLLQRFPSYLFQIYNTCFSIDEELAACIYVQIPSVSESLSKGRP